MWRALLLVLLLLPGLSRAQDTSEADRGFLTALIEDNLSGAGREVRLQGFAGALSSRATIDTLTIADAEGVWLTIRGAALQWNRSALLRGRIEVAELAAEEIVIDRVPAAQETGLPETAAEPFRIPDLPVSVEIGTLDVARLVLGAPILGERVEARVSGALSLSGGTADAALTLDRLDAGGQVTLDASFGAEGALDLALSLSEPQGGLVARALDLPGEPALDLTVQGSGPLTGYAADITLASDGQPRLTGTVSTAADNGARTFAAQLSGDIAPLFAPEYRAFFGDALTLDVQGQTFSDGSTELSALTLDTGQLQIDGRLSLAADGLPDSFDLTGTLANGQAVRLPVTGDPTTVQGATLALTFDAAQGDRWTGRAEVQGLARGDTRIGALALDAGGTIARPGGMAQVTADLVLRVAGLALDDPALQSAIGPQVALDAAIDWRQGAPVDLSSVALRTDTIALDGTATLGTVGEGLPLMLDVTGQAPDLSAFAQLAGRPLQGAVEMAVDGTLRLLDDRFDLAATVSGEDLRTGISQLDAVLGGRADIAFDGARDETGITLRTVRIQAEQALISAEGVLRPEAADVTFSALLDQVALVVPTLDGPARVQGRITGAGALAYDVALTAEGPGQATATFDGTLTEDAQADLSATGTLTAEVGDLSAFAALAGRPLAGSVALTAEGAAALSRPRREVVLSLQGTDLRTGIAQLDPLLTGPVTFSAGLRQADDLLTLTDATLSGDGLSATATATLRDLSVPTDLALSARLADAGRILQGADGPARLDATLRESAAETYAVTLDAAAPGGLRVDFAGQLLGPPENLTAAGTLSAAIETLSAYAPLVGRPIAGSLQVQAEGRTRINGSDRSLTLTASGANLRTGIDAADRLLSGPLALAVAFDQTGDTAQVRELRLSTGEITADLSGTIGAQTGRLSGSARLRNLGLFAPDFPGALTVQGDLARTVAGRWQIDLSADGPGGTTATVQGDLSPGFETADIGIRGSAPLGLVNPLIAPRAVQGAAGIDLRLAGPLQLSALSGRVTTQGARLIAPTLGVALGGLGGAVTLGGSAARVDLSGTLDAGGQVSVGGSVGLTGGNVADLTVTLSQAVLRDPDLFQTLVNGQIALRGPLSGGATIGGALTLGRTEVQVAPPGGGSGTLIEGLDHVNEPADVRQTRARAGLIDDGNGGGSGGGGAAFPLDLTINAPGQIFIRGRGLDAELGGTLRLTGTTANVVPQGQFDLIRGRLDILGRRLDLTEGRAVLQGDFDPVLRLVATTQADDLTVRVVLDGPASDPDIRFESAPDLPEDEVLARLFFGRGLDQISPLQAAQLASAVATLAGGGQGVVGSLRENFGLDDLDISTDASGNAAVRAGRYLSENLYTDVTIGSDGGAQINLNLDVSRSVTVRGGAGSDGEASVGIYYERDY
jgi:translocation and assembly module TamB